MPILLIISALSALPVGIIFGFACDSVAWGVGTYFGSAIAMLATMCCWRK